MKIPPEGLKILAVAGMFNGNPIWRQAGVLRVSKSDKPVIYLDRTFNPAGIQGRDPGDAQVMLTCVEYTPEEMTKKASYRNDPKPVVQNKSKAKSGYSSNYNDMDDDIPF